jgi:hypothetical protein
MVGMPDVAPTRKRQIQAPVPDAQEPDGMFDPRRGRKVGRTAVARGIVRAILFPASSKGIFSLPTSRTGRVPTALHLRAILKQKINPPGKRI